jgi:hypothetical protein
VNPSTTPSSISRASTLGVSAMVEAASSPRASDEMNTRAPQSSMM